VEKQYEDNERMEVILMGSLTFTDGRNKFKRGVPVPMTYKAAKKYELNGLFSVRTVENGNRYRALENRPRHNADAAFNRSDADAVVGKPRGSAGKPQASAPKPVLKPSVKPAAAAADAGDKDE
jgi:hypothetical protein